MLLYLHGFRSSPQSFKARLVQDRMREWGVGRHYACPVLDVSPAQAIARAEAAIAAARAGGETHIAIIGSSLGGFYARWLAEKHGCRAALLNPAVHPWTDLEQYLGDQPLWHGGGTVTVERAHLQELLDLRVDRITAPERYYLLAAFPGAHTRVIDGSDHGISGFAQFADEVLAFCGYGPAGSMALPPGAQDSAQ